MITWIAFYARRRVEVYARSQGHAQLLAAERFGIAPTREGLIKVVKKEGGK